MCPSSAFLFCLDPQWIGWGPPALVKAISFTWSTNSKLPTSFRNPFTDTPRKMSHQVFWASISPVKVTHTINHHDVWIYILLVLVLWKALTDTLWTSLHRTAGEHQCKVWGRILSLRQWESPRAPPGRLSRAREAHRPSQEASNLQFIRSTQNMQQEARGEVWGWLTPSGSGAGGVRGPHPWMLGHTVFTRPLHLPRQPSSWWCGYWDQPTVEPGSQADDRWPCSLKNQRSKSTKPIAAAHPGAC